MSEFEEYIKAKYQVDYESLKEKYPNVPVCEFYGDEQDIWDHQQAKIDELQARIDEALKILKDWDDQSYRDDMDQLTGEIEDILKENGDERLTKIRVP